MDRSTRLSLAHAIVERTRDYPNDALNDLFRAMDDIERTRELIPKLTEAEETANDGLAHAFGPAGDKRALAGKLTGCLQLISRLEIFSLTIVKW